MTAVLFAFQPCIRHNVRCQLCCTSYKRHATSEWGIPRTGYLIPVRDTLWDLPGWESCWDAGVAAVAVGVTWYHYYQYAHFSDITTHPKFKSGLSGGKNPLREHPQADKAYIQYNTIQYSTVQYITLHYTIIPYNTIIPLCNVYTLGYPDGFIQCIYSGIPWWFYTMIILAIQYIPLGGYTNHINNSIYSVRWGTIL